MYGKGDPDGRGREYGHGHAAGHGQGQRGPDQERWLRRARWLIGATLATSVLEAAIGLWAAISASSLALLAFSLDSGIEMAAGIVVLRRLGQRGGGGREAAAERRARRFVGVTLLLLAAYVVVEGIVRLAGGHGARESVPGIIVVGGSLVLMPLLAWGKLGAARALGSGAVRAEAMETLACAYLSAAALAGQLATALAGWWWADAVAALVMAPWLVREGLEALEGDEGGEGE